MALIWADFPSGQIGLYGSNISNMLDGIWAQHENSGSTLVNDPDPNIGSAGRVLRCTTFNILPIFSRYVIPTGAKSTVGMGFRLWPSALPFSNQICRPCWGYRSQSNSWLFSCIVNPDGSISAYYGGGDPENDPDGSGTLVATSNPCITASTYNHVEMKVVRDASAGSFEVRVNGVAVINETSQAFGTTDISMIVLGGTDSDGVSGNPDTISYYKDLVLWDGTGTGVNDFQGSVSVFKQDPDADQSLNWTPSTGATSWDLLDDTNGPDDADYISADDTPPAANIVTMTNLPEDTTTVRGLITVHRSQKNDGGDCKLQAGISPNGTNWDDGADRQITPAFTYWTDVSELSPATASQWSVAEVNSLQYRINRTL